MVQDAVVVLEVAGAEHSSEFFFAMLQFERRDGQDEVVLVLEILLEEVQDEVATASVVRRVHGHLAEEVAHVGFDDGDCSDAVPKVVEREDGFDAGACTLVFYS